MNIEELRLHKHALDTALEKNCVCVNEPETRDEIRDAMEVASKMFGTVIEQLEQQVVLF
tara:strand:- start:534 stop:710 length:177 start_codon:yes stop_codon:yes gene_type:complete